MTLNSQQQTFLKMLPGVDSILLQLRQNARFADTPKRILVSSTQSVLEHFRNRILGADPSLCREDLNESRLVEFVKATVLKKETPNLIPLVNATGIVIHTNLGRSLLCRDAIENVMTIAGHYSNLEFNLETGRRGLRYSSIEDLLCEITGAESALAVNNNAGAVLLCLDTLAKGREVIVSRGELVEIGGSFRIPDIMAKSGGILKEVGTTNRTHRHDYVDAINENTGLLLKVHTSNYSVVGFTAALSLREMVALGKSHHLPVMEDLGSGTLVDLSRYGLTREPTVQESVAAGVNLVTFSGDKLLGGPQAGIIVGDKNVVDKIKRNPLTRALRIDKMTLAALESTLRIYRDESKAVQAIPTLQRLTVPFERIAAKAVQLRQMIDAIDDSRLTTQLLDLPSRAGGGSLPLLQLPSKCVGVRIEGVSENRLENHMRRNSPPIIGRIENDSFIMDLRTIHRDDFHIIKEALKSILQKA